jgi:hypothetical protein
MTRVVLLGASNLAIGLPLIVRQLFAGLPRPLEIFTACGHGRSFCTWSRVLFRALPGIDRCGLWTDLDQAAEARESRTLALVTDVGNDLIYGSSPPVIARRVESCLEALARHRAELVVTRLPLASVERLSALRYHATKAVFFPRTGGRWPEMLHKARELDESLGQIAAQFSARLVEQPLDWYGFDPLHIRRSRRAAAWRMIFTGWPSFAVANQNGPLSLADLVRLRLADLVRLRLAAPAERRLFGRQQMRLQPALELSEVPIRLY